MTVGWGPRCNTPVATTDTVASPHPPDDVTTVTGADPECGPSDGHHRSPTEVRCHEVVGGPEMAPHDEAPPERGLGKSG